MTGLVPDMSRTGSAAVWSGFEDRDAASTRRAAGDLYRRVSAHAWLGHLWARLSGRPQHLPALVAITLQGRVVARHHGGNRTVLITAIRGSENRSQDFDRDFRPLNPVDADRWESVAGALLLGDRLPAVDLVQVGDAYYVRDGHHRVSAARALGQAYIDATVTVWELDPVRQDQTDSRVKPASRTFEA